MSTTAMSRLSSRMSLIRSQVEYLTGASFVDPQFKSMDLESMDESMSRSEAIHSGHFMVSEIDDFENGEEKGEIAHESDYEQPDKIHEESGQSFDFELPQETTQKYCTSSHIVTIDASLSKLFKCMSLAYSGKLTSPKWKTFKGMKLKLKDKIRLNNIIWRAWHMQYVISRKPPVCQFASLVDCDSHNKPEAVVLEGKYWKRRLATVTAEYQKWRLYHKEKSCVPHRLSFSGLGDNRFIDWTTNSFSMSGSPQIDDDFVMDFNDTTLFNSLLPPNVIDFPNPREIARSGLGAEFIQPGLTQLQPSFDDYMDLDYLLSARTPSGLPPLLEETSLEQNTDVVKLQRKMTTEDNTDFLSSLDTIVQRPTQLSNTNTFVSSTPVIATIPEQNIKLSDPISLTNETTFLRDNTCSQTVQSLSAICSMPPRNEVQNSNEVPVLSLGFCKPDDNPFENYKWKDRNVCQMSETETKLVPVVSPTTDTNLNKFAVPKQPMKQRTRSRSISSPQSNNSKQNLVSTIASNSVSLNDVTVTNVPTQTVERSASLPVYNQRRNAIGPLVNAQLMQQQQQLQNHQNVGQDFQINSMSYMPMGTDMTTIATQQPQQALNTPTNSLIVQLLARSATPTRINRHNNFEDRNELNNSQCNAMASFDTPLNMKRKAGSVATRKLSHDSQVNRSRSQRTTTRTSSDVYTSSAYNRTQQPNQQPLTCNSPSSFNISPVHTVTQNTSNSPIGNNIPIKAVKPKTDRDRLQYKEHRRVCHINAEQKRRFNIKNGFDTLRSILPSVNQNSSTKISKAAMLQKAAEHIRSLKTERQQQQEEHDMLTKQIESLNTTISVFQGQLPATGAPFSCQRTGQIKEGFDAYVEERVIKNWKFWIFSIIMKPLLESYNNTVSTSNMDEMYQSVLRWLDQNCTLLTLRPNAIAALRQLSTSTNILTNPSSLPEEILESVAKKHRNVSP